MEKTKEEQQRIKDAVLAEMTQVESIRVDGFEFAVSDITSRNFCMSFKDEHHENTVIWLSRTIDADDPRWWLFYSALGLEARALRESHKEMHEVLARVVAVIRDYYPALSHLDGSRTVESWKTQTPGVVGQVMEPMNLRQFFKTGPLKSSSLLEAARRVCNESMAEYAVTTQAEHGVLSEGFEQALSDLMAIVDQYQK